MKFLVTGGLGFIGQRVVRNLLARGIPTVSADDSPNAEAVAGLHAAAGGAAEFDAVTMDVSDFRDVMAVFHKHPDVSHAIHLAYVMGPLVDENTSLSTRVNVLGMANMFEAAVHRQFVRLVFTSSETVYGPSQEPTATARSTKTIICDPATHFFTYAVMKLLNEHMARRIRRAKHGDEHRLHAATPSSTATAASAVLVMWAELLRPSPRSVDLSRFHFPANTRHVDLQG